MNARTPDPQAGIQPPALLRTLAARAIDSLPAQDEAALHAARRCLVDWLGVALAGHREPPVRLLRAALGDEAEGGDAFGASRLPAYADAWVMGTAGHVLDYDDTDFRNLIHVSATQLPALVALARRRPVAGDRLLRAIVAGYELEAVIGRRLGRLLTARGWHVSGVIGHFGAALACGIARGLDAEHTAQALGVAATGASGLIAAFGTMSKSMQLARSAAGGVLAADLAASGFTGAVAAFEGDAGFATTYTGERPDWSGAAAEWGNAAGPAHERWAIVFNSFKPHAACMITHPAIDAAVLLRARLAAEGLGVADIAAVQCLVNPLAPKVAGHALPITGLEGKFSVAYCVAAGLLDGHATPDAFAEGRTTRPEALRLLSATQVQTDAAIGEQQAEIAVQLADGRRFSERTAMARGNPANPLTDAELGDKFLALAGPRVRDARALLDGLWRIDRQADAGRWLFAQLPS